MRPVAIVGIGQTPVGEHWSSSLRMLAADAIHHAFQDASLRQVDSLYIGNAYGAAFSSQQQLGSLVADYAGLGNIEACTLEAGDASGAAALRAGYLAVASGAVETALVLGVEKSTDTIGSAHVEARGVSLDADYEAAHGVTLTALAALLMRRYMYEHEMALDAFEGFSINAHANGARNEYAMFRNIIKPGRFAKAPMIADPVSLFDSAPDGDGAAAVILTSAERAADLVAQPVIITASAAATDTLALQDRADMLHLKAVQSSASRAFAQAGLQPDDVSFFELHDAYTVLSALALEASGFAERGQGCVLAQNNAIGLTGKLPLSTFGGLKARGNPAGAVGVYQAVEATMQLRGIAGANQVVGAKVGLLQNLGGLGSSAYTHILRV